MEFLKDNEKAILIGINDTDHDFKWAEFVEMVRAAGALEVGRIVQERERPDPAYFIGSGKARVLAEEVQAKAADLVISIQELSPVQARNLSELTGVRVIDRTNLVLDIFAQRAQSKEGKLQVELAQLNYLLPRLGGVIGEYSRSGGGIGTRGPGETRLEIDRRRIRKRLADLRREIELVEGHRSTQRRRREKNEIPTIALVGYTNAGKSSLFNRLTQSSVSAQNRLFDTLDPVARSFALTPQVKAVLLDTVGFVSDLPHQLVAAFKATLEETVRATVLLQVMDANSTEILSQYTAVRKVLAELAIDERNIINILNKVDLLEPSRTIERLTTEWSAFPISARTGFGVAELVNYLTSVLTPRVKICRFVLPYSAVAALDLFHRQGKVLEAQFTDQGINVMVEIENALIGKYQNYLVDGPC